MAFLKDLPHHRPNGLRDSYQDPDEEIYLFNNETFEKLDWNEKTVSFRGNINLSNPGPNLKIRSLSSSDFDRGYVSLLSQLTSVGDISRKLFQERFFQMKSCPSTYYIIVVEDTSLSKVIGTASVIIEQKFIHSAALRSRIEDVVVDEAFRGFQLGKLLVQAALLLSKHLGCYKVSLECKEHNIKFYETFGFQTDQTYLVQRFKE